MCVHVWDALLLSSLGSPSPSSSRATGASGSESINGCKLSDNASLDVDEHGGAVGVIGTDGSILTLHASP